MRNKDPNWRPRRINSNHSFSIKGLLRLMGALGSPVKKNEMKVIRTEDGFSLLNETIISPSKGLLSPNKKNFYTPKHSQYPLSFKINCNDNELRIYLPKVKCPQDILALPAKPNSWIDFSPIPPASMDGISDLEITLEKIKKIENLAQKRKKDGQNPRGISQDKIMQIPAYQALQKAGIDVTPLKGKIHYTHFAPWTLAGDEGQCVENLGIGTSFANARMELINPALKSLFKQKNGPKKLYLTVIPTWKEGFEKIRLLEKITYLIKDAPKKNYANFAKIEFDMLSLRPVCESEIEVVEKFLKEKFSLKEEPKFLPRRLTF